MDAKSREVRDWLLNEWAEKLCQVVESMADQRPIVSRVDVEPKGHAETAPPDGALLWTQGFAVCEKSAIWVGASQGAWLELGRRTLAAAGVNAVEESECRSTFHEILSQSMAALGEAIGIQWRCAGEAELGQEVLVAAKNLTWVQVEVTLADIQLDPIWFAAAPAFLDRLSLGAPLDDRSFAESAPQPAIEEREPAAQSGSKTFDLLLDVTLPVSISFGRTLLSIKEVLRLNSGSIIELDRAISEPVEVIVNNCVVARGEVVVIDGNYGVRIQEIASRNERLKTGAAASQGKRAIPVP